YPSFAFPAISPGVYGSPKEEAGAIAVRTVPAFLPLYNPLGRVLFVCFDEKAAVISRRLLASSP
ncbi:O-acetyl-ADP-ribose deacetylase, partial [Klebsiella pneumoniae]